MSRWTAARIARVLGGAPGSDLSFPSITTDTRAPQPGALFVALAGERFDGHAFLAAAAQAGAAGAVVRRGTPSMPGLRLFEVDDTLLALGQLARARRDDITGPVVGVTGTNGKTATKEMIAAALRTAYRAHATPANLNNLVGVPLTILGAPEEADALVVEAGASIPGEVARLRAIIGPTIGVITNVAPGHLEGFGSVEAVLEEKLALVTGVPLAVVGTEPVALGRRAREVAARVVVAGVGEPAEVRPERWRLDADGRATLTFRGRAIRLPLIGAHQAANAMLALALASELGLDLAAVSAALGSVRLPPGRGEVLQSGRLTVINDAYNANPRSLGAALETARAIRAGRRLVVAVGTMLELGAESRRQHERMADAILALQPDLIAAVGEFAEVLAARRPALGERLLTAADPDELGRRLAARLQGDELVLVKASRGVRLERAIPHLLPSSEASCSTTT